MIVIELDHGKILTGKPNQFDGKNHGFRLKFSQQNQSSDSRVSSRGVFTGQEHVNSIQVFEARWTTDRLTYLITAEPWNFPGESMVNNG